MQNFTAQPWDAKTLNDALQEGLERQKTARFKHDWNLAVAEAVQRVSNAAQHYAVCRSAACRRARRCVDNKIPCTLLSERELQSAKWQRMVKSFYVRIQQERRAAIHEGRPPRVADAVANYKPRMS